MIKEKRDRACPQEGGNVKHWGVATLSGVKSLPQPSLAPPEAPQAKPPPDCGQSSEEIHLILQSLALRKS